MEESKPTSAERAAGCLLAVVVFGPAIFVWSAIQDSVTDAPTGFGFVIGFFVVCVALLICAGVAYAIALALWLVGFPETLRSFGSESSRLSPAFLAAVAVGVFLCEATLALGLLWLHDYRSDYPIVFFRDETIIQDEKRRRGFQEVRSRAEEVSATLEDIDNLTIEEVTAAISDARAIMRQLSIEAAKWERAAAAMQKKRDEEEQRLEKAAQRLAAAICDHDRIKDMTREELETACRYALDAADRRADTNFWRGIRLSIPISIGGSIVGALLLSLWWRLRLWKYLLPFLKDRRPVKTNPAPKDATAAPDEGST